MEGQLITWVIRIGVIGAIIKFDRWAEKLAKKWLKIVYFFTLGNFRTIFYQFFDNFSGSRIKIKKSLR